MKQCFIIEPAVRVIDEIQWVCLEINLQLLECIAVVRCTTFCFAYEVDNVVQFFPCKVIEVFFLIKRHPGEI